MAGFSLFSLVDDVKSRLHQVFRWKPCLRESGLFDEAFYLTANPDLSLQPGAALDHYLRYGAEEGRAPNPWFDSQYYQELYPDTALVNPLWHFITYGAEEGRLPNRDFRQTAWTAAGKPALSLSVLERFSGFQKIASPTAVGNTSIEYDLPAESPIDRTALRDILNGIDAQSRDYARFHALTFPDIVVTETILAIDPAFFELAANALSRQGGTRSGSRLWLLLHHVGTERDLIIALIGVLHAADDLDIQIRILAGSAIKNSDLLSFLDMHRISVTQAESDGLSLASLAAQARKDDAQMMGYLASSMVLLPGCLRPAVECLQRKTWRGKAIGFVGGKELSGTGYIRSCGGIQKQDGMVLWAGRGDAASHPDFSVTRQVDQVSRNFWLSSLDALSPDAVEDHVALVQPVAIAVNRQAEMPHFPLQDAQQPRPSLPLIKPIGQQAGAETKRILVIDHLMPPGDASSAEFPGTHLIVDMMGDWVQQGCDVTFMPDDFDYLPVEASILQQNGIKVVHKPWFQNIGDFCARGRGGYDMIVFCRYSLVLAHQSFLQQRYPDARFVYCCSELTYPALLQQADTIGSAYFVQSAKQSQQQEMSAFGGVDKTFFLQPIDPVHSAEIQTYLTTTSGQSGLVECQPDQDIAAEILTLIRP